MSKVALVTGGAGFIGSHMVDLLLTSGYKVRVIDNLIGGHKKNLKHCLKNKNLRFKKADICKLKHNDSFFKGVKYVFHFAGIGDIVPSIVNPSKYMLNNVQGTVKVLEASRFHKIKKFIYAASSSCYGKINGKTKETERINIEHPYALSKYLGEQVVFNWHKVYKLPINSIRIFNAYGPRVRTTGAYGAVMGVFLRQKIADKPLTIVGDGRQSRDFIHVKDVVKAFLAAAKSKISGEIFNLGAGKPQSVNKLAKIIGGYKINIPDRPGEPKHSKADITKIKRLLKWSPKISFKNGLKGMINEINDWKNAPLWTPKKIKKATQVWFKYLSR